MEVETAREPESYFATAIPGVGDRELKRIGMDYRRADMRIDFMDRPGIFFDQDGTLSRWRWIDIEEVRREGYFRTVVPQRNVITASSILVLMGYPVGTYGAAWLADGHSVEDKEIWMNINAGHIKSVNRVYVPCGTQKASFFEEEIGRRITPADILIDDCSEVLRSWESFGGIGIKVRTPENGRHGTWDGYSFSCDDNPDSIAKYILYVQNLQADIAEVSRMVSGI